MYQYNDFDTAFIAERNRQFRAQVDRRVAGNLTEETREDIIDKHWNNAAAAWYEQGRQDPSLLMLRMDLGDAEIWEADPGVVGIFKMMTGITMKGDEMGDHAKVAL